MTVIPPVIKKKKKKILILWPNNKMKTAKELQHAFISFSLKYFYYGLKKNAKIKKTR